MNNTLQSLLLSASLLAAQYKNTTNILPDAFGIRKDTPQAPANPHKQRVLSRKELPIDIHFHQGGRTAAQKPSRGIAPRRV